MVCRPITEYSFKFSLCLTSSMKHVRKTSYTLPNLPNGEVVRNFRTVPHEDPEEVPDRSYRPRTARWSIRKCKTKKNKNKKDQEDEEDQNQEQQEEQEEWPKLLKCNIYGELAFLETGPYGNWIPQDVDKNPDDIMFPVLKPSRAMVVIGMRHILSSSNRYESSMTPWRSIK